MDINARAIKKHWQVTERCLEWKPKQYNVSELDLHLSIPLSTGVWLLGVIFQTTNCI